MTDGLVTTEEAAALLGVKQATIYSYVSRGRLESIRKHGDPTSWFRRADVDELVGSRRGSRKLEQKARLETVDTQITQIEATTYRYRGHEPSTLIGQYSFEQVAELLWTGEIPETAQWLPRAAAAQVASTAASLDLDTLPLDRLRLAVSALAATDHLRFGQPVEAVAITARHMIADMVESLPLVGEPTTDTSLAARLWPRLSAKPATELELAALEGALIVIADHGVAPSTLAARIAAAYRSDLYGVVQTGLAILAGAWHGGRALSAEEMLDEIRRVGDVEIVVGELYRRGAIPCLGQPRYPGPDPRAAIISDLLEAALPGHGAVDAFAEVQRITRERGLPPPSVELALAALAHAFEFTKGASEVIFAIGRTAGWIAHGMEAYANPSPGPPTFNYVGAPTASQLSGNGHTGSGE